VSVEKSRETALPCPYTVITAVSLHREGRGNPEVVAPFFDKLQIDVVGGVIGVIEFAVIP
jgi:hypothetical protein